MEGEYFPHQAQETSFSLWADFFFFKELLRLQGKYPIINYGIPGYPQLVRMIENDETSSVLPWYKICSFVLVLQCHMQICKEQSLHHFAFVPLGLLWVFCRPDFPNFSGFADWHGGWWWKKGDDSAQAAGERLCAQMAGTRTRAHAHLLFAQVRTRMRTRPPLPWSSSKQLMAQ